MPAGDGKGEGSGMTGVLTDVSKIGARLDQLGAENAGLKAEKHQLLDDLAAARAERDDAQSRATRLAAAVDAGEAVEREDGDVRTRDLVTYRLLDVVTGDTLEGAGVVVRAAEGGLTVAPLSPLLLTLAPEAVQVVPAEAAED